MSVEEDEGFPVVVSRPTVLGGGGSRNPPP